LLNFVKLPKTIEAMKQIVRIVNQDHPSPSWIGQMLRQQGFRRLGSGASTITYGKARTPYVVKVNENHDPAAYKFYSMVTNQRSRYFPKIHLLKTFVSEHGEFFFVVITERLFELTDRSWKRVNPSGKGFASWLATQPDARIQVVGLDFADAANRWQRRNGSHIKLVNNIINATAKYAEPDLFDGNLMVRLPSGDVVLNDPVCTVT
jgi:hypothetical protein